MKPFSSKSASCCSTSAFSLGDNLYMGLDAGGQLSVSIVRPTPRLASSPLGNTANTSGYSETTGCNIGLKRLLQVGFVISPSSVSSAAGSSAVITSTTEVSLPLCLTACLKCTIFNEHNDKRGGGGSHIDPALP
ncbi:TPA: hypothetical protein ACH3X2_014150 [Trebouxia sp. C0005]